MKTRLTKKQTDELGKIIYANTIIGVEVEGKEVWDCTGKRTKVSEDLEIRAYCKRINVRTIVGVILEYVSTHCI